MHTLKILTFNTWLLKTPIGLSIAKDVEERLQILPQQIALHNPDIISLQEVWHPAHRKQLLAQFAQLGYRYSAHRAEINGCKGPLGYLRSSFGNGLMVFSKFPMREETHQLRFSKHTRHDEVFVMKGAIFNQIEIPKLGWVDFYNSHLGAISFDENSLSYDKNNINTHKAQVNELAQFIQHNSRNSEFMIAAVDLGIHYQHYETGKYTEQKNSTYEILTCPQNGIGLLDSNLHLNGTEQEPLWTFHKDNPYVSKGFFQHNPNEVIDYIFVNDNPKLRPIDCSLVFDQPLQDQKAPMLSDHYGMLATFSLPS